MKQCSPFYWERRDKYMLLMREAIGKTVQPDKEITLSHKEIVDLMDYVYCAGREDESDSAFEAGISYGNPGV